MQFDNTKRVTVVSEPLLPDDLQNKMINKLSSLHLRVLTALIFIPIVLGSIWMGKPYFDALALFILVCMTREWSRMVMGSLFSPFGYSLACLTIALFYLDLSFKVYTKLVFLSFALSFLYHVYLHKKWRDYLIYSIGACYMTGALFILIYMAHEGLELFFMWMMLVIWASDTGAYFAGRFIGGPKLAPSISPNKTWAGFCGGLVFSALVGYVTAPYLQEIYKDPLHIICVSMYLSFMGHVGDLLESLVKRYYHVKDSGSILPGHGGMLDRFDSLLLVSFAAGLLLFLGL